MLPELPGIELPDDADFLWKYMSFEKFVSLLGTKSLYFTRADKFEDPLEGFIPPSVKEHYKDTIGDITTLEKFQENWITDTVKSAVQQYGFEFKVNHSTLLDAPSGSA